VERNWEETNSPRYLRVDGDIGCDLWVSYRGGGGGIREWSVSREVQGLAVSRGSSASLRIGLRIVGVRGASGDDEFETTRNGVGEISL